MMCLYLIQIIVYLVFALNTNLAAGTLFVPMTVFLYVASNILYLAKYKKDNLFCFELLFAISFFLCSFISPFVLPLLDSWHSRVFIDTNDMQIKCYAVSYVGYLAYLIGLGVNKSSTFKSENSLSFTFDKKTVLTSNVICLLFIILFYLNGGTKMWTLYVDSQNLSDLSERLGSWGQFLSYAMYVYVVCIVTTFQGENIVKRTVTGFAKSIPLLFYINTISLVVPLLFSGYRSNALQLLIPGLMIYSIAVKRIKTSQLFMLLMIGFVILQIIGFTRSGDSLSGAVMDTASLMRDFIPANGANSYLISYVDENGPTWGSNMLLPILSIVPYLQSIALSIVDRGSLAPVSSSFYTKEFDSWSGLGTNIIGDLYYSFDLWGVVILMFMYGVFLKMISNYKSPYQMVLFAMFTGNALFAPRVEYCYIIRTMTWGAFLMWLIIKMNKKSYYQN